MLGEDVMLLLYAVSDVTPVYCNIRYACNGFLICVVLRQTTNDACASNTVTDDPIIDNLLGRPEKLFLLIHSL
jgi:hypothetical protein